ncbi:MAG: glycosyltransferase [Clostridia bacterium]|nr:glycosyltransferase [Clostridia bacterium]
MPAVTTKSPSVLDAGGAKKRMSIVTPCYFNEKNLDDTYAEIKATVFDLLPEYDWEWILVDDGSGDNTLGVAQRLQRQDPRIRIVKLSRNFGEFRAVVAGLSVARGEAIAVICADLQDPPSLIPHLVASWQQGNKVNLAVRGGREGSRLKNWFADTYYRLIRKWVIPDYPERGFDFFLIDRKVAQELVRMQEKNSSIYLQLIWLGYRPTIIEYDQKDREKGVSMWTYSKRINLFVDTFIVFSHKPIRFLTGAGLLVGLISLIFGVYVIFDKIINHTPAGWASVMLAVLLTSSFQMVMMGVLGEYLWRNLDETRKRPLYVIDEVMDGQEE